MFESPKYERLESSLEYLFIRKVEEGFLSAEFKFIPFIAGIALSNANELDAVGISAAVAF